MSIEPTCNFCGKCTKFRCRDVDDAETCSDYTENRKMKDEIEERIKQLSKARDEGSNIQFVMTDNNMEAPITVESHYDGTPQFIALRQNDNKDTDLIVLSKDEVPRLIKMLRMVLDHVCSPT